jgi:hypothetical protein
VARVELSEAAARDLQRLILTYNLPADTPDRLLRRLRSLERFPRLGPALGGRWTQHRYVLGPWRWMVVVYEYLENQDLVLVVTIVDGRSKRSPTSSG